jgi:hypothetical protein
MHTVRDQDGQAIARINRHAARLPHARAQDVNSPFTSPDEQ